MAVAVPTRRILLADFSGGLNVRDSPNELALSETPSALNWTADERGSAKLRNGFSAVGALPGDSGTPAYLFYSSALRKLYCARQGGGTFHHLYEWTGAAWTDRGQIGAGTGIIGGMMVAFADWPGTTPMIVMSGAGSVHLGSGGQGPIVTWDGSSMTIVNVATTRGGWAGAVWQNRVWFAGNDSSTSTGNRSTLYYSRIGDPTDWAPPASLDLTDAGSVDLRTKDGERITAMGVAGGALIVFKRRSAYRVYDSDSGAYQLIDGNSGAVGPLAVVPFRGRLYTWGEDGIYEWDGTGPGRAIADKLQPLIVSGSAAVGSEQIAGGVYNDRVLFAYTSGAIDNDAFLEGSPSHEWFVNHQLATTTKNISSWATQPASFGQSRVVYAAVQDGNVFRQVFANTPGSDAGTLMTNNYRTPWIQPEVGHLSRLMRVQVEGLLAQAASNVLTMNVYRDWDLTNSLSYNITTDLRSGAATDQKTAIVRSLGHARSFALEFVVGTAAGSALVRSAELETIGLER